MGAAARSVMPRRLRRTGRGVLLLALGLAGCGGEPTRPETVATVIVEAPTTDLASGEVVPLTVRVSGSRGGALTGRTPVWSSSDVAVAAVSGTGIVTAGRVTAATPAEVTVAATVDGVIGRLALRVRPLPVAAVTVSPPSLVVRVGESASLVATPADSTGTSLSGRAVTWTSLAPAVATVGDDGTVRGVTPGRATIRAVVDGRSATAEVFVASASGLAVVEVSPMQLVPGATVTITGAGFTAEATPPRVLIGGAVAPVLSVTATQLTVRAPCTLAGPAPVRLVRGGDTASGPVPGMTVPRRTLAVGQSLVLDAAGEAACNELAAAGGPARYVALVYSVATSPNTLVDVELGGNPGDAAPLAVTAPTAPALRDGPDDPAARAHLAHLERERARYLALRASGAFERPARPRPLPAQQAGVAPGDRRVLFYNFGGCRDTTVRITVRAVHVGQRGIVWEDTANTLQAAAVPALAAAYDRLGRIFDRDQYASVRATYGDPLLRDAETDRDGRVSMVFTQRLNGSGAAAYVTSCDQAVRGANAPASNEGEFFYGSVPTTATPSVTSTASPEGWAAFMARTVVHEVKHIASMAQRVANRAPSFESSWLEEGTARHAEEVWARDSLHRVPWKGNTGWGSATTPGVYCDFNLADAACAATDTLRRPAWGLRRQLHEIRPKLLEPWNWSPFGDGAGQSGAVFYNTTWSLVRYAIDRYGASDAAFLGALNRSVTTGIANLTQVAGVPLDRLLGEWGLALYADDWPGLPAGNPDVAFPTWNLRSIYAGLSQDPLWRASYPTPYPLRAVPLPFGGFTASRRALRGGAHAYFELSGTQVTPQLLSLSGPGGTALSPVVRLALLRLP